MNTKTNDLPVRYIITAIKDDKRVYYGVDSHSGGYPYWASWIGGAHEFDKKTHAVRAFEEVHNPSFYMAKEAHSIQLGELIITLTTITKEQIVEEKKKEALAKLTEEDKHLLGL